MTFDEDELRRELEAVAERIRASPRLLADARAGGRRRLRRRRAWHVAPLAAAVTSFAVLSPHLSTGDRNQSGAALPASPQDAPPPATGEAPPAPSQAPEPTPDDVFPDAEQQAREAFFAAGYTFDDAVRLGASWNQGFDEAKVTGGRRLLSGQPLPFEPRSGDPTRW